MLGSGQASLFVSVLDEKPFALPMCGLRRLWRGTNLISVKTITGDGTYVGAQMLSGGD